MSSAPGSPSTTPSKATLVCESCGREAPVGKWLVTERRAPSPRRVVACPNCGSILVVQPRYAVTA